MANTSRQPAIDTQGASLQALLAAMDSETAQALALDAAYLKERASLNIRRKKPYISFMLGSDEMALSIDSIQEIGYLPTVTPLPNLPPWIKGIVQIRGEILSVVDFLALFGLKEERIPLRRSYILFRQQDFKFCLIANRITGVVNIDERRDTLHPYSSEMGKDVQELATFFKGTLTLDQRAVCILDNEKLGSSPLIRKWHR